MKNIKKAVVVGLGYVGLPTMVAIARSRVCEVVGYDLDKKKIKDIKNRIDFLNDKDISLYLRDNSLLVSSNKDIMEACDVFIICVPTPVSNDHQPDYSLVESAVLSVCPYLRKGAHVVLESTVNPGTCEERLVPIIEKNTRYKVGRDINVAHCPERISPGDKRFNVYNINRNIGSINKKSNEIIADFYRAFITGAKINEVSNLKIAEATKIVENTFRDINIAYVNELAMSFDKMGIDIKETLEAASNKPFSFLPHWPGCGVGGHCIAVDPYYLIERAALSGFDHKFLKIAREINNGMPLYTVNKLVEEMKKQKMSLAKTSVLLLGLTYKANIADTRESPSMVMWDIMKDMGMNCKVYDPFVKGDYSNLADAVNGNKAIILGVGHQEFLNGLNLILKKSKVKIIIDGKNCLDKEKIKKMGIIYRGIGR